MKQAIKVFAVLLAIYAVWDFTVSPRVDDMSNETRRYELATEDLDVRTVEAKGLNVDEATAELAVIQAELPPTADQKAMIAELVTVFDTAGVVWESASTSQEGDQDLGEFSGAGVRTGGLVEVGLSFNLSGSIDQIRNALTGLTGLQRRYTVTAMSLTFSEAEPLPPADPADVNNPAAAPLSAGPARVQASITASAWVWSPSEVRPPTDPGAAAVEVDPDTGEPIESGN